MIVETFIAQLRANAPIFGGRIAGAAEFYAGLKNYNTSMALPAAYVLPLGQEADANPVMNGLIQMVHKGMGIAVELDATADRRGQTPVMQFDQIEAQLFRSVLNLFIDDADGCPRMTRGVYFQGARYLDLDRARLFYQWEFGLDWQISDADGVQPTILGDVQVEVDIFGPHGTPPAGTPPAAVVVVPSPPAIPPTDGPWPGVAMTWDDGAMIWDDGAMTWEDNQ